MTGPELTETELYLLHHAIDMAGWLAKDGVNVSAHTKDAMANLRRRGLFEFVDRTPGDVIARYVITDAGRAAVGGLR